MTDFPTIERLGTSLAAAARDRERQTRRRQAAGLGAALCALAAAALALLFSGARGVSLAERAYAAIAHGPGITHVVFDSVDPTDASRRITRWKLWIAEDGCRARSRVEEPPGRFQLEVAQAPREERSYDRSDDAVLIKPRRGIRGGDAITDPFARPRDLLHRGEVTTAEVERDGRTLLRFSVTDSDLTMVYLAEPKTFTPVRSTLEKDGRVLYDVRYRRYERLDYDPQLLTIEAPHSARVRQARNEPSSPQPKAAPTNGCR